MIGVFDSGLGGLAVFKEVTKALPNYDYIYLGDNARAPYGDLSQDIIYQYTQQAVDYLFAQGCSLIILACNTVSAEALRKLQQEYLPNKYPGKNVLGIIRPLSEIAATASVNKNIAVLGTQSTISSNAYQVELQEQDKKVVFVGDGINDAPSLVQADLGIAMGAGTDIAKESGNIILMKGDPRKIVEAIKLSKKTFNIIKQNLFWAFFYNVVAIPLAIAGLISPMLAAVAMSLSSVTVIANSLRIYRNR